MRIEEKKLKTELNEEIEQKVNDIFVKFQNQLGITSGDIMPPDAFKLEEVQSQLAEIICRVLIFELDEI